jgi:hypothetical protein
VSNGELNKASFPSPISRQCARPFPCRAAAGARRARHKSSFHASALGRASRIVDHATADETAAKKLALDVTALRRGWGSGE